MLSAVIISSLMKGFNYFEGEHINRDYLPGSSTVPHVIGLKMKQISPKVFGFSQVGITLLFIM
jgi:hypothetical protein